MMRWLLIGLLVMMGGGAGAQNWQTVRANDTGYYRGGRLVYTYLLDSSLLRTVWIDSARLIGGDSVFFFFRGLRDNANQFTSCIDTLAPSWLGSKMIRRTSGTEYYFNSLGDTITLMTGASVGSNWILAKDTGGQQYRGTVMSAGVEVVDGVLDSVKTISIQAFTGTAPVADQYNNMVLKLSKNYGWIKTLDLYRFPNKISKYARFGIIYDDQQHERLPMRIAQWDLYHVNLPWRYAAGNETILETRSQPFGSSTTTTTITDDSVLASRSLGPNSIAVDFLTRKYSNAVTASTSTYLHTDTITQSAIGKPIRSLQIYESKPDSIISGIRGPYFNRYYVDSFCSNRLSLEANEGWGNGFTFSPVSNCWRYVPGISGFERWNIVYLEGFGTRIYFNDVSGGGPGVDYSLHSEISYAKLGGCGWGTKYNVLSLSVNETLNAISITIAPNPANDKVVVTCNTPSLKTQLSVYNITGQKLMSQALAGASSSIATEGLSSGLYFFEISDGVNKQVFKVTIQH